MVTINDANDMILVDILHKIPHLDLQCSFLTSNKCFHSKVLTVEEPVGSQRFASLDVYEAGGFQPKDWCFPQFRWSFRPLPLSALCARTKLAKL